MSSASPREKRGHFGLVIVNGIGRHLSGNRNEVHETLENYVEGPRRRGRLDQPLVKAKPLLGRICEGIGGRDTDRSCGMSSNMSNPAIGRVSYFMLMHVTQSGKPEQLIDVEQSARNNTYILPTRPLSDQVRQVFVAFFE